MNRLSNSLAAALNNQMAKEAQSMQTFLSYASWADNRGYAGIANYLFRHSEEFRRHMMIIFEYILKRGSEVQLTAIPAPSPNPANLNDCFVKVFQHEVENTKGIYLIVELSTEEKDKGTLNFMQWFVKDQIEKETIAMSLLDKLRIAVREMAVEGVLHSSDKNLSAPGISLVNPNIAAREQR